MLDQFFSLVFISIDQFNVCSRVIVSLLVAICCKKKPTFFFFFALCLVHIDLLYIFQSLFLSLRLPLLCAQSGCNRGAISSLPLPILLSKMTTIRCSFYSQQCNDIYIYTYIYTHRHTYIDLLIKKNKTFSNLFCHFFSLSCNSVYKLPSCFFFAVMGREHSQICHSVAFKK
jgi:hypothetical protein